MIYPASEETMKCLKCIDMECVCTRDDGNHMVCEHWDYGKKLKLESYTDRLQHPLNKILLRGEDKSFDDIRYRVELADKFGQSYRIEIYGIYDGECLKAEAVSESGTWESVLEAAEGCACWLLGLL